MNREIKFRAWTGYGMDTNIQHSPIFSAYLEKHKVMQYTGLKDKNGKEIYEGDIVRRVGTSSKEVVEYNSSGFFPFAFADFGDEGYGAEACEITGNIYELND